MYKTSILLMALFLASCSVIKIANNDETKIYRKLGFVNVVVPPNHGSYVESRFFGLGFTNYDLVLGYKHAKQLAMTNNSCTVFIESNSKIDNEVLHYLETINCNFIFLHGE